jgi:hypothetical protein
MSKRSIRFTSAATALAAALFLSLIAAPAPAQQIVVPGGQSAAEGNTNNAFPFDIAGAANSMRYQQVYGSGAFGTPSVPLLITQIAFRPDTGDSGAPFASTLANVRINLSTTSRAVDDLSTTFANNVGTNNLTVFSGPLSLSSNDTPAAGGSRAFDIIINLATPFLYDPAAGNLLLDVFNFAGGQTTAFDAQNTVGDAVSRVYNNLGGVNATTGTTDSTGLVTRFAVAVVPESSTLALALPALAMAGAVIIKRRKK